MGSRFELDGKKWVVEYMKDNPSVNISDAQPNQTVYIFKCTGTTIKINGKVNAITLDFINCQSVQMQVLGKVNTISVEKTDGCQMFINQESIGVEIVSAKSSEMNVVIPDGDDVVEQ